MRLKGISGKPREYVLCSLQTFITSRTSIGEDIILKMDANEALRENGRMRDFLMSTGLMDVMDRHGEAPRTCLRSQSRIDFIFTTPGLVSSVCKEGHIGVHDAITSDHAGI